VLAFSVKLSSAKGQLRMDVLPRQVRVRMPDTGLTVPYDTESLQAHSCEEGGGQVKTQGTVDSADKSPRCTAQAKAFVFTVEVGTFS
jgi:hypothetical protein